MGILETNVDIFQSEIKIQQNCLLVLLTFKRILQLLNACMEVGKTNENIFNALTRVFIKKKKKLLHIHAKTRTHTDNAFM